MWAGKEVREALIHFAFENFEGLDVVGRGASAFQREVVEFAKANPSMAVEEGLWLIVLQGVGHFSIG